MLRERGQRATTARRAVLQVLLDAGDEHVTADELERRVSMRYPEIHLSTIYRTLEALADVGVIAPARFGEGPVTYHLATDEHHHAVCTRCGATLNLAVGTMEPVRRRLLREFGFHADPHHLTLTGLCAQCADDAQGDGSAPEIDRIT